MNFCRFFASHLTCYKLNFTAIQCFNVNEEKPINFLFTITVTFSVVAKLIPFVITKWVMTLTVPLRGGVGANFQNVQLGKNKTL